jgi:hypothetical protein
MGNDQRPENQQSERDDTDPNQHLINGSGSSLPVYMTGEPVPTRNL